jgi:hypothetical protein
MAAVLVVMENHLFSRYQAGWMEEKRREGERERETNT